MMAATAYSKMLLVTLIQLLPLAAAMAANPPRYGSWLWTRDAVEVPNSIPASEPGFTKDPYKNGTTLARGLFHGSFGALAPRDDTCVNGEITCGNTTCDKCETCCDATGASSTPCGNTFGECCGTDSQYSCRKGYHCYGSAPYLCCPEGTTGCVAGDSCCYPGATCGASGCVGNASTIIAVSTYYYTSTVVSTTTNVVTITSASSASDITTITTASTSTISHVSTVTAPATTVTAAAKRRREAFIDAVHAQLIKYSLVNRAASTSVFYSTSFNWVTQTSTVSSTKTVFGGGVQLATSTVYDVTTTDYYTTTTITPTVTAAPSSGGLGAGAIAGISVGSVAAVAAVIGAILVWFFRFRHKKSDEAAAAAAAAGAAGAAAGGQQQQPGPEMQYAQNQYAYPQQAYQQQYPQQYQQAHTSMYGGPEQPLPAGWGVADPKMYPASSPSPAVEMPDSPGRSPSTGLYEAPTTPAQSTTHPGMGWQAGPVTDSYELPSERMQDPPVEIGSSTAR